MISWILFSTKKSNQVFVSWIKLFPAPFNNSPPLRHDATECSVIPQNAFPCPSSPTFPNARYEHALMLLAFPPPAAIGHVFIMTTCFTEKLLLTKVRTLVQDPSGHFLDELICVCVEFRCLFFGEPLMMIPAVWRAHLKKFEYRTGHSSKFGFKCFAILVDEIAEHKSPGPRRKQRHTHTPPPRVRNLKTWTPRFSWRSSLVRGWGCPFCWKCL